MQHQDWRYQPDTWHYLSLIWFYYHHSPPRKRQLEEKYQIKSPSNLQLRFYSFEFSEVGICTKLQRWRLTLRRTEKTGGIPLKTIQSPWQTTTDRIHHYFKFYLQLTSWNEYSVLPKGANGLNKKKKMVATGKYLISVPSITKSFATKFLRKCTSDITCRFFCLCNLYIQS